MIAYNPKDWLKLIFIFHKSDTFRMLLPALLIAAAYSTLLTYLSIEVHYLEFKSTTVIHSLLGFVISMLLVFRTNTAYDRWWEGRKLWGELVNSSRNFALKINTMIPSEAKNEKDNLNILIGNFPFVLKEHLRGRFKAVEFETNKTITTEDLNKVNHKPNALIWAIEKEVMQAYKNKNITNEQLLLLNDELKTMANVCGACERIKNTPIPYSYSMFLKKFIFASTAAVYGDPEDFPVTEKSKEAPVNVYGQTKLEIDKYLAKNAASLEISTISFRFFNVGGALKTSYGKWLRIKHEGATHLIPSILHSSEDNPLLINGNDWPTADGTPVRDFVHVTDLVNALVKSLTHSKKPGNIIINIGTATGSTVLEVVAAAESALGRKINYKFTARRAGDSFALVTSNQAARDILDWVPVKSLSNILEDANAELIANI